MHDAPLHIDLREPAHVGIVIMRPHPGRQRGVLLLNVAETEARIRFLPGYLSVSFFVDREGKAVAEYVRWRSAKHLAAAFAQPAFHEHLPVVATMEEHPTIAFGTPAEILTAGGRTEFELTADNYAMSIIQCAPQALGETQASLTQWYRGLVGENIDAVAIHVDTEKAQIAVLVAGSLADVPAPQLQSSKASVIAHIGALRLYSSVTAGSDPALALRYAMAVSPGAHPGEQ